MISKQRTSTNGRTEIEQDGGKQLTLEIMASSDHARAEVASKLGVLLTSLLCCITVPIRSNSLLEYAFEDWTARASSLGVSLANKVLRQGSMDFRLPSQSVSFSFDGSAHVVASSPGSGWWWLRLRNIHSAFILIDR